MLQPLESQYTVLLELGRAVPWIEYPVCGPPLKSGLKNPLRPDPGSPGFTPNVSIVCQYSKAATTWAPLGTEFVPATPGFVSPPIEIVPVAKPLDALPIRLTPPTA